MRIYCEDARAVAFLRYVLKENLAIATDSYMLFSDVNLGWTNYLQLVGKGIPEFRENIIVLDNDVRKSVATDLSKKEIVSKNKNICILPLTIEKDLFCLLKNFSAENRFQESIRDRMPNYNRNVCFSEWPLQAEAYKTEDFKHWYERLKNAIGDENVLFAFWCDEYPKETKEFVKEFVEAFNMLAESRDIDAIPWSNTEETME